MPPTNGWPHSVVPSVNQSNSTNSVLERDLEMQIRRPYRSPTPRLPSKKGGIQHHLDNFQCETSTIESTIRQAYKRYTRLKKDTSRCDTWLKQLVEAQAQQQKLPWNPFGKRFIWLRRSGIMPKWLKWHWQDKPTGRASPMWLDPTPQIILIASNQRCKLN